MTYRSIRSRYDAKVCGLTSTSWVVSQESRYWATVIVVRLTYSERLAATRASSRAFLASRSVANPPTQRGRLRPVSGSRTRMTYDQVVPRRTIPSFTPATGAPHTRGSRRTAAGRPPAPDGSRQS